MTEDPLTEIRTRLAVVQSRLRNNYYADPDDCVWAVEQVSVVVGAYERLRADVENTEAGLSEQIRLNTKLEARAQTTKADAERLRGLLARLEWAGICEADDVCPACYRFFRRHEPDCWLAKELGR